MTYSVIPALRRQPDSPRSGSRASSRSTTTARSTPAADKAGALCGMAMTEKQGGSDVRANTTVAVPINGGGPGAEYELTGHKWFCSAPMCDAFLVLAQAEGGISCFLMPRWTPDGERNRFHIQRLKDKLGNRSNASSEVEFRGAWAQLVGEEGRGVRDDHRDGQPHPARLHDRLDRRDARRRRAGDLPHRSTARPSASGWSTSR